MIDIKRETQEGSLSDDYIRGLVEGEGCFTFCSAISTKNGERTKVILPSFTLTMHERDKYLIEAVRNKLAPRNRVYTYRQPAMHTIKKIYKRGNIAMLTVRDIGQLKNNVVPFFYNKLFGNKERQFVQWLEDMGNKHGVPENYKLLYRLHKSGYWDKNQNLFY